MADWVHCNKCSTKIKPNLQFYLFDCGHILCRICVEKACDAQNVCLICKKRVKSIPLGNNIDKNVADYFTPLNILLKKAAEVNKFQTQHMGLLFQNMQAKYELAKKEYLKAQQQIQELKRENQLISSTLLMQNSSRLTSTPKSSTDNLANITFQNTSNVSTVQADRKNYPGFPKRLQSHYMLGSGSSSNQSSLPRIISTSASQLHFNRLQQHHRHLPASIHGLGRATRRP